MLDPKNIEAIFEGLPVKCILLRVDSPRFTIADVNDAFCLAVHSQECNLIDKVTFEIFPKIPNVLKSSLELVIAKKNSSKMAVQKYDTSMDATGDFNVKYWIQEILSSFK